MIRKINLSLFHDATAYMIQSLAPGTEHGLAVRTKVNEERPSSLFPLIETYCCEIHVKEDIPVVTQGVFRR